MDVALLSLGSTAGLRQSDDALAAAIVDAGATCSVVRVQLGATARLRRQIAVTDLVEGLAARRATRAVADARALIVSGATTSLLLRRPGIPWALRFDAPTTVNRPGLSGAWQRTREARVLPSADVLLPTGSAAAAAAEPLLGGMFKPPRTIVLPIPVDVAPVAAATARADEVVAYAGWFQKRGIDLLCQAWAAVAPAGVRLVIGGCDAATGTAWLRRRGVVVPEGVEWAGLMPREQWLQRVARARCFVNASRLEEYGIAPLEALALGTPLVTMPSAGPYEALPIARRLAPACVAEEVSAPALAAALRAGLALQDPGYAARAAQELVPYRRSTMHRTVRHDVLPALGL